MNSYVRSSNAFIKTLSELQILKLLSVYGLICNLGGDSDDDRSQGQIQAAREKPGQFKSQAYVEDSSSDEDFNPSKKMDSSDDEKEKPNKSQAMLSSSDDEAPARKMESSDDENTTKKLGT